MIDFQRDEYPRASQYDAAWLLELDMGPNPLGIATPALRQEISDLGYIPDHIKAVVGWEALAWHTADWWRFHWQITDLVNVTSARLQPTGHHDWLTWSRATNSTPTTTMLEKDNGNLLTFALVTARKPL